MKKLRAAIACLGRAINWTIKTAALLIITAALAILALAAVDQAATTADIYDMQIKSSNHIAEAIRDTETVVKDLADTAQRAAYNVTMYDLLRAIENCEHQLNRIENNTEMIKLNTW